jgi:membrane protein DedA with SNARE-associated domain
MHTVNFLIRLVEHHQILVYGVIYLGLIFEGEFVVISAGIVSHLGTFHSFGVFV